MRASTDKSYGIESAGITYNSAQVCNEGDQAHSMCIWETGLYFLKAKI